MFFCLISNHTGAMPYLLKILSKRLTSVHCYLDYQGSYPDDIVIYHYQRLLGYLCFKDALLTEYPLIKA